MKNGWAKTNGHSVYTFAHVHMISVAHFKKLIMQRNKLKTEGWWLWVDIETAYNIIAWH